MSKYRNKQSAASDGKVFSSGRERQRYEALLMMQRLGLIRDLECQVKYVLIPLQRADGFIERGVTYTADFRYVARETCIVHVEDAKGAKTQQYVLRRKMMLWFHKIRVEEV